MYHSTSGINYGLQRPDEDEWPSTGDDWEPARAPMPKLEELKQKIVTVENEVRQRGKPLSGHIIMACHTLPYTCNIRPVSSGSEALPVEIQAGDRLIRQPGLHSPTVLPPSGLQTSEDAGLPLWSKQDRPPSPSVASSLLSLVAPVAKLATGYSPSRPPSPGVAHHARSQSTNVADSKTSKTKEASSEKVPSQHRWSLQPRRGHAAMNAGLRSLADRSMTLVAWPGDIRDAEGQVLGNNDLTPEQKDSLDEGLSRLSGDNVGVDSVASVDEEDGSKSSNGIKCSPVWLDDKDATMHYEDFCKGYLWPLFHYMPLSEHQDAKYERAAWHAYERVNQAFANKIASIYRPGDLIWIQDYHLLLLPGMLKKLVPNCHIGLFLHSPFPSSEFFRCLPRREPVLSGMLGADLLCFQTYSYGRHFVSSCIRVMGCEAVGAGIEANGAFTAITHCPIGVDADRIELDRQMDGVAPKIDALRKLYSGKKIIVARDKLDPTKGVLPKLKAFEEFLRRFPEWRGKVVLIQVTTPSPTDHAPLAAKISELVDAANAEFGSLHFQPIHHYHQTVERDEYFALLSVADLAIITSVRDGMNTTSMEYTICQAKRSASEGGSNPLILSEFTGVTGSMKTAIKVNPWDLGGVAIAIQQCLTMPADEKEARHQQLYSRVKSHSSAVWANSLVLQLTECLLEDHSADIVSRLDVDLMAQRYITADKRLLLFDYDGTLTPIVKNPPDALPPPGLHEALRVLCSDPRNIVYIISGRDAAFIQEHLGNIENLGMSAEHGCFLREPATQDWIDLTEDIDMSWMHDVEEIFKYYEARTMGAIVEKKVSSVTWHYRNADPDFGLFQARECQALLESMQERLPIDVLVGKKNLEVRPAHTNKGEIVKRLLYTSPDVGFVLCAGDDKTDEDMFRALRLLGHSGPDSKQATIAPPHSLTVVASAVVKAASIGGSRPRSRASSVETGDRSPLSPRRRFSANSGGSPSMTAVPSYTPKLEPVKSDLDAHAIFSVVIDENERRRTMASSVVKSPHELIGILGRLANETRNNPPK